MNALAKNPAPSSSGWSPTRSSSRAVVCWAYALLVFSLLSFDLSPLPYKIALLVIVGALLAVHLFARE